MTSKEKYFEDMRQLAEFQWKTYEKLLNSKIRGKTGREIIEKILEIHADSTNVLYYIGLFLLKDVAEDTVIEDYLYLNPEVKDYVAERIKFLKNLSYAFECACECHMVKIMLDAGCEGCKPHHEYAITTKHVHLMNEQEKLDFARGVTNTYRKEFKGLESKFMSFSDYWKILEALADETSYVQRNNPVAPKYFDKAILDKIYDSIEE